jgi:hypothetical protein
MVVAGGFWALPIAVQITSVPTLTIVLAAPGNAMISWSPNTAGYILQQTTLLSPANWTNSPPAVQRIRSPPPPTPPHGSIAFTSHNSPNAFIQLQQLGVQISKTSGFRHPTDGAVGFFLPSSLGQFAQVA